MHIRSSAKTLLGLQLGQDEALLARLENNHGILANPEIAQGKGIRSSYRNPFRRKPSARVVLPQENYRLFAMEAPPVPETELREAMRWKIADQIDFDAESALIEVCPMGDGNRHDGKDWLYVAATSVESALQAQRRAMGFRLNVSSLTIPEIALKDLAIRLPEAQEGFVFLHADPERVSIFLVKGSRMFVSRSWSFPENQESQAYLEGLIHEIRRVINFFDSHYSHPTVKHLRIMGDEPIDEEVISYLGEAAKLTTQSVSLTSLAKGLPTARPGGALAVGAALGGA